MTNSIAESTSAEYHTMFLSHPPSLAGNIVLLLLFALLFPVALALGARYKSRWFAAAVAAGLALEVVGYIGRLVVRNNSTKSTDFAVFLVGTTAGPTCICGAIFSVMSHIVAVFGDEYRSWSSVWYPLLFIILTLASLAFELAGSIVSTVYDGSDVIGTGIHLLVTGLAVQLVALVIFVVHGTLFAMIVQRRRQGLDPKFAPIRSSRLFGVFIAAFTVTTTLIIIRTAYRIPQISGGFQSPLAQDETLFLVLDGAAMLTSTILLLACFPARALGRTRSEGSDHRPSQDTLRPIRLMPIQPLVTHPSPPYTRMRMEPSINAYSPVRTNRSAPRPEVAMVDSDNLW